MQAAIWLIGLFSAAVALALFAGDNPGSVTVFWPPHRIDLSVNLALLLLATLLAVLYISLRVLSGLLRLPHQARRWRTQQRERGTTALMLDTEMQLRAGRYSRARQQAVQVLARLDERQAEAQGRSAAQPLQDDPVWIQLRALAHRTAAEAALALQDEEDARSHLEAALTQADLETAPPDLRSAVLLQMAGWALQRGDLEQAAERLAQLAPAAQQRVAARRLRLQMVGQEEDAEQAERLARQLERRGLQSVQQQPAESEP